MIQLRFHNIRVKVMDALVKFQVRTCVTFLLVPTGIEDWALFPLRRIV